MKYLKVLVLSALIILLKPNDGFGQHHLNWLTNLEDGITLASKMNKSILVYFHGSDWCPNCKRMEKTLLETQEFTDWASERLILVSIDFPKEPENQLPPEQQEYNNKLKENLKADGFPTILILNNEGVVKGKLSVRPDSTDGYLKKLEMLIK